MAAISNEIIELGYMCALGTLIDICVCSRYTVVFTSLAHINKKHIFDFKFNRFYHGLIVSNWYLLPQRGKMAVLIMLQAAQRPNDVKVLGILTINIETYLSVIIHSIGVYLFIYNMKFNSIQYVNFRHFQLLHMIYSYTMILRRLLE